MYFDRKPFSIGSEYTGGNLAIGNTVKGKEISWVNVNGLFVADHVICTNISWDDLNKQGFIFGKEVSIDGTPYFCRSLKVGNDENIPNEWDDILDASCEDDSFWHWKDAFFWGQETSKLNMAYLTLRGYCLARYFTYSSVSLRNVGAGFRPALEPLVPDSLISDSLIGTTIIVYGNGGNIRGTLSAFTGYDLFLSLAAENAQIPDYPWCCQQEDGTVIIDRSAVTITGTI